MSTLAALQVLVGGAALTDTIGAKAAGLFVLAVAALQTGVQFYVRGQVTPWDTVVAKRTDEGVVVAGPSAQAPTGVQVEEPAVVETPPPDPAG
jgi:methylthioribose-1-phosphate isomerase